MPFSPLPLSYCTNVHPGRTLAEVEDGLDRYTVDIQRRFGHPLAAGLWLAQPIIRELQSTPDAVAQFRDGLTRRGLTCHTLNAFPYGDFHSDRVKEQVYLPDWTDPRREGYTLHCAEVLAQLLPPETDGSISTVPLGFKALADRPGFIETCIERLLNLTVALDRLRQTTGRTIRLAIEPEPLCVLETTPEAIAFFEKLFAAAATQGIEPLARNFLGLCYDVCHQAVEFEDVPASLRQLRSAGIRINKLHISCAIHLDDPGHNAEGRAALARYVEPRYLHQTFALLPDGGRISATDLDADLASAPPAEFANATAWRIHFHVPVDSEALGPLRTTRPELRQALETIRDWDDAPHLEVETYTWEVLPDGGRPQLAEGFARELTATRALLAEIAAQ